LASNQANDVPAIVRHFGGKKRVAAMHIRNVKHLGYRHFRESSHLSADGDLDMYEVVKAMHDTCPDICVRPDHGRAIWDEKSRPGYGLYDRALGATYLNGLFEAIRKGNEI
jgi:mannonate dehydratase